MTGDWAILADYSGVAQILGRAATTPLSWAVLLFAFALWLMVPPSSRWRRAAAIVLGAVGVGLSASLFPPLATVAERSVFWILSGITLLAAGATVAARSPVYSAVWFALSLLTTAGLFLISGAQFLGAATVIVYAGAIVVTILFVLMLAQPRGNAVYDRISWGTYPAATASLAGAALVGLLTLTTAGLVGDDRSSLDDALAQFVDDEGQPRIAPELVRGSRFGVDSATGRPTFWIELAEPVAKLSEISEFELQIALGENQVVTRQPQEYEVELLLGDVLGEDHVARLGGELLGRHLVSVEVAGVLLLVALVGAVAIVIQGRAPQPRDGGPADA